MFFGIGHYVSTVIIVFYPSDKSVSGRCFFEHIDALQVSIQLGQNLLDTGIWGFDESFATFFFGDGKSPILGLSSHEQELSLFSFEYSTQSGNAVEMAEYGLVLPMAS